ncbi:MAG: hypothetical protein Q4E37_06560 [Tissierellia bacterium]|nr:hypothetical protein [Tissierellia bacterium]
MKGFRIKVISLLLLALALALAFGYDLASRGTFPLKRPGKTLKRPIL